MWSELPVIHSERAAGYSANALAVWFLTRVPRNSYRGASSHSGRRSFITGQQTKNITEAVGSLRDIQDSLAMRAWRPDSDTLLATARLSGT